MSILKRWMFYWSLGVGWVIGLTLIARALRLIPAIHTDSHSPRAFPVRLNQRAIAWTYGSEDNAFAERYWAALLEMLAWRAIPVLIVLWIMTGMFQNLGNRFGTREGRIGAAILGGALGFFAWGLFLPIPNTSSAVKPYSGSLDMALLLGGLMTLGLYLIIKQGRMIWPPSSRGWP